MTVGYKDIRDLKNTFWRKSKFDKPMASFSVSYYDTSKPYEKVALPDTDGVNDKDSFQVVLHFKIRSNR